LEELTAARRQAPDVGGRGAGGHGAGGHGADGRRPGGRGV